MMDGWTGRWGESNSNNIGRGEYSRIVWVPSNGRWRMEMSWSMDRAADAGRRPAGRAARQNKNKSPKASMDRQGFPPKRAGEFNLREVPAETYEHPSREIQGSYDTPKAKEPFLLSRQKQKSHFYFPAKSKRAISTFPPKAKEPFLLSRQSRLPLRPPYLGVTYERTNLII
jgi:hypothetical protein